jgi:hypothetical protein
MSQDEKTKRDSEDVAPPHGDKLEDNNGDVAPGKLSPEEAAKAPRQGAPHFENNPPSVQPGNRGREQI